ncbi:hypothetical protein [Rahnella variigena]|uniref:hypothetical protein n=1 Tax=Rahnella variigena TaxID=574964 RepID=UPI00132F8CDD|nr:hypothetical protein [Rahnella variigena]
MTEKEFELKYPKEKHEYAIINTKTKGTMGQTEIEIYNIIDKDSGNIILKATRTEHTRLRGMKTTVSWD